MNRRILIDTNVVVRYLVQDEPRHAAVAGQLFAASDRGEMALILLPEVLAESVFVLGSVYDLSRSQIAKALHGLVAAPGVQIPNPDIYIEVLKRYATSSLHFVDCVLAATASVSATPLATFDRALAKAPGVQLDLGST